MYSFDVFDTLITRKTAVPEGIFAIMQCELERKEYAEIPVSIRNNFYRLRIEAERLARYSYQRNGIEDVTLEQIYNALAVRGELSETQRKQLVDLECEMEYRECVPIEKNVAQVKKLLSDGKEVILISDMYLPKKQIYKMLAKADPVLTELSLYVSGDCKKRKHTGAIYEFAMKQSHFTSADCIHTGDNEKMDVIAAENAGLHSRLSWFPDLLPIEKKLLDQTPCNIWLNRVIGCSRRARLELGQKITQKDTVPAGTSIGGILICSYIQWVLRNAVARGIRRLYFVTQGGYVLKRVADILIQKLGILVETYDDKGNICSKLKIIFSCDRSAFVAMMGNGDLWKYLSDLLPDLDKECVPIFLFGLDQITVPDNCIKYAFYPGRIRREDILEQFCGISGNQADYLTGIEKFAEYFCEDGHMAVQLEDIEQISKILRYVTEASERNF